MKYFRDMQSWLIEKWELTLPIIILVGNIIKHFCLEVVGMLLLLMEKLQLMEALKDVCTFLVPCVLFTLGLNLTIGTNINLIAISLLLVGLCRIITILVVYLFFPDKK